VFIFIFCVIRYIDTDLRTFSEEHREEFDIVILSEVIEHVPNKEEFLKWCVGCLKVISGKFFFADARKEITTGAHVDVFM